MSLLISYIQLLHRTRSFFGVGFHLSYRLFLACAIAVPCVAGLAAFAFGLLHHVLNPDMSVEGAGVWVAVLSCGAVWMFSGSRRKQLDSPLASMLPNADWRFYSQRGSSVVSYIVGRFFLVEIGKYVLIIALAAGFYLGVIAFDFAGQELLFLAYVFLCPALVAGMKVCLDAATVMHLYEHREARTMKPVLTKILVSVLMMLCLAVFVYFFGEIFFRFSFNNPTDMLTFLTQRFEDNFNILVYVGVLIVVLAGFSIKVFYSLRCVRWVDVTGRELRKIRVFKKLPELSEQWFRAVMTVDWRRTRRSFYDRAVPLARTVPLNFLLLVAAAVFILNGGMESLPPELSINILIPYGLGMLTLFLSISLPSFFSMDADRHAYALWRTTDEGIIRIIIVRSVVSSLFMYSTIMVISFIFLGITRMWEALVFLIFSIAFGVFLGALRLVVVSFRWPKTDWAETPEIGFNLPCLIALSLSSVFMAVFSTWNGLMALRPPLYSMVILSLFLVAVVPIVSMGLCLAGYRVLRKGIRAC